MRSFHSGLEVRALSDKPCELLPMHVEACPCPEKPPCRLLGPFVWSLGHLVAPNSDLYQLSSGRFFLFFWSTTMHGGPESDPRQKAKANRGVSNMFSFFWGLQSCTEYCLMPKISNFMCFLQFYVCWWWEVKPSISYSVMTRNGRFLLALLDFISNQS